MDETKEDPPAALEDEAINPTEEDDGRFVNDPPPSAPAEPPLGADQAPSPEAAAAPETQPAWQEEPSPPDAAAAPQDVPADAQDAGDSATDRSAEAALTEAAATVEAILFSSDSPLPATRVSQVGQIPQRLVKQAVAALNERYEKTGAAFRIELIAGGYQMLTLSQYHDVLSRLLQARSDTRLSQAAMETLAIIAYRQPVLRADVEAVRGVASGEVLRGLMEKQLVKIVGRAEVLGRPLLYGTTKRFLEVFGLAGLEDLPKVEEFKAAQKAAAERQSQAAKAPVSETAAPAEASAPPPAVQGAAGQPQAPAAQPTSPEPSEQESSDSSQTQTGEGQAQRPAEEQVQIEEQVEGKDPIEDEEDLADDEDEEDVEDDEDEDEDEDEDPADDEDEAEDEEEPKGQPEA